MVWARVDDGWWCHPKTVRLDLTARGLWVSVLSWSCAQRTPHVPPQLVAMLGAEEATAKQIEATGLWHGPGHDCDDCDPVEDGWVIHDWSEYQERSLSEKRAEAGRKGGRKSRPPSSTKQTGSNDEPTGEAGARPGPALPETNPPQPPREASGRADVTDPLEGGIDEQLQTWLDRRTVLTRRRNDLRELVPVLNAARTAGWSLQAIAGAVESNGPPIAEANRPALAYKARVEKLGNPPTAAEPWTPPDDWPDHTLPPADVRTQITTALAGGST